MNNIAINGRAMMAMVALMGRYMPKLTYLTTRKVIRRSATPIAEEIA